MSGPILRRARPEDAAELTALTIRSKAYWGYSQEFMQKALLYLNVSIEQIETEHVYLIERGGRIAGYYQMHERSPGVMWLESLFVLPEEMGRGFGAQLMHHAIDLAQSLGYQRMEWESDPHAEAFYVRFGAVTFAQRESGIQKGRMLPQMRLELNPPSKA